MKNLNEVSETTPPTLHAVSISDVKSTVKLLEYSPWAVMVHFPDTSPHFTAVVRSVGLELAA